MTRPIRLAHHGQLQLRNPLGQTLVVTALESPTAGTGAVYVVNAPPTDQLFGDGSEP